jgi:SAM-dependent methyltransferase
MKFLDRVLQQWRIRKVRRYLPAGCRVLDIGCAGSALLHTVPGLGEYVGIDPGLDASIRTEKALLIKGWFPADLPQMPPFDVITLLAVFEHIPPSAQAEVARACAALIKPSGQLLVTVPSAWVDRILDVLEFARLVDGIAIEQHYGFDSRRTPAIFSAAGLTLVKWKRFQLGLNNLFVFRRTEPPACA